MSRMDRRMVVRIATRTMVLMAMAVFAFGCGEETGESICTPGELQVCPCIGGGEGIQECDDDGQGWGQCPCSSEPGDGGGDSGGADDRVVDSDVADSDVADSGVADSGVSDSGVADSGDADSGVTDSRPVTIWAHTFNGALGPGSGLQPGDMETEGSQGYTDGGSWVSMGGWLSKTISTIGYNTIEVDYLLTKDAESTCELNVSINGGNTWINVLRDNGPGGYRLNGTLPESAEGEPQVLLRWTALNAWCWMNEIRITALGPDGRGAGAGSGDMNAAGDADSMAANALFHIFLLMGQSNMVGSDIITRADRTTDERVSVLGYETCPDTDRVSNQWDIASPPLHTCSTGIGPGDYFAKTLVEALPDGHTMGLVPTAVSGQWIETFLQGGIHHQNILDKIRIAAGADNARFSGIIFHQGEANNGDVTWPGKVQQLYTQVKAAMGIDYDIPFIAGEMLYGGNCEGHNALVRQVPDLGDNFDYVSAEGLVMAPGDEWLVHFDHGSQVTLGQRYGEKMRVALGW